MATFDGRTRPPVIAVYAPDGTGKSTLLDALERLLGPDFTGTARWHQLQLQNQGATRVVFSRPHDQVPRSMALSIAKIVYYLALAWIRRRPQIVRETNAGKLVLIDRDICDPALDPRRYRMGAPQWVLNALIRCGPKPDVAFVLDADSRLILQRSDELTEGALDELRERYRRFGREAPFASLLDANEDADKVAEAALRILVARGFVSGSRDLPRDRGDGAP